MSIEKELHDELVEGVEATDEESMVEANDPGKQDGAGSLDDDEKDGVKASAKTVAAVNSSSKKTQPANKAGGGEPMKKVAKEDVDFSEDLDALVESEATLSEGFRAKASVIFEAALKSKLTEEVDRIEAQYEQQLSEEVESMRSDLVEKVDGYLNYVVEQWMEENELAVESGIRTEIAESFIGSLHQVFAEHYVEVPESKVDLVDELAEKVESLEEKYSKAIGRNIELSEEVGVLMRDKIIAEGTENLSVAQAEKLKSLVEDVAFEDVETFKSKVATIKESYFTKSSAKAVAVDPIHEEVEAGQMTTEVSPMMQRYLDALKQK